MQVDFLIHVATHILEILDSAMEKVECLILMLNFLLTQACTLLLSTAPLTRPPLRPSPRSLHGGLEESDSTRCLAPERTAS